MLHSFTSYELLTAAKIQVVVLWVMTCSDVAGYQRFRGPWCLHLQGVVSYRNTTQLNDPEDIHLNHI